MTIPNPTAFMAENAFLYPEEEKRIVTQLNTTTTTNFVKGDPYFVISKKWYRSWQRYVEEPLGAAPRPGPIDNHHILETDSRLLVEDEDYLLVPQQVWKTLLEWYKGGPAIPRTFIYLFLLDSRDDENVTDIRLPKEASIRELYDMACDKTGVSLEKAHIWDYLYSMKGELLDPLSNKSLDDSGLVMNQDILLEVDELSLGKGLAGLVNLGNTCYMNTALQCLAHTPPILEYFLRDYTLNQGELAKAFGELLKQLWSSGKNPVAPRFFKTKLDKAAPQFSGYKQQDSHELLISLLAGLQEDCDIVNVCQGQYKSTLVCPVCGKSASTYESFMCLSLPLPSTLRRSITVTVFSCDGSHLPMPYTVTVPRRGSCSDLVTALRAACCLTDDESLLLAKVYEHKIFRYFENPLESLSVIKDDDHIVAYRMTQESGKAKLEILHGEQGRESVNGSRDVKFFGTPFVTCLNTESLSGSDVDAVISGFLFPLHRDQASSKIHAAAADRELSLRMFLIDERYLDLKPFQFDSSMKPGLVTRILVEWNDEKYDSSYLRDLPQVYRTREEATSLYSCLEEYLAEEPLGPDNMWDCPECKEGRQANKKLDLWKLPEILVFHLKRFKSSKYFMKKIDTFVNFPVKDLELSKYVKKNGKSYLYELYAASNHYGGIGGVGHYTAYAKLVDDDNKWYHFNDSSVSPVNESEIRSSAAYLLFYRRVGSKTETQSPEVSMTDID